MDDKARVAALETEVAEVESNDIELPVALVEDSEPRLARLLAEYAPSLPDDPGLEDDCGAGGEGYA